MTRLLLAAAAAALLASPAAAQMGMGSSGTDDQRPLDTPTSMGTGLPSPDSTDPTLTYSGTAAQRAAAASALGKPAETGSMKDPMIPADSADSYASNVSTTQPMVEMRTVTNGPVPDTRANRDRFGGPTSRAGKMTVPRGN